ncbi:hypothetical protein AB0M46_19515 [Dactylosporangium sp. NPDC051485]|uniref:hypothetical protein n=1 Tax=Dactylosporangium sp. NPDC051485 TaxID=3154846 RepID=UPI003429638A
MRPGGAAQRVGALVVAGLNRVLGDGWYRDLPGGNGVDQADPTGAGGQGGGGSKCRQPSAETTGKLPKLGGGYTATINPCLSFVDVLANLNDMVPERGEKVPGSEAKNGSPDKVRAQRERFHRGVAAARKRIGTLVTAKDAVQCGYATDHLAIGLYQAKSPKWSAGVVAVLKGDIDAVTETAVCTLLRQIPGLGDTESDEQPAPRVSFCFDHRRQGDYTWMWLGSSDVVCTLFADKLGGGSAEHPQWPLVWADPLTKRDGPHPGAKERGKLPFGTPVDPDCQVTGKKGDEVVGLSGQPDNIWVKLRDGSYVSHAWLIRRDRQELNIPDCDPQ